MTQTRRRVRHLSSKKFTRCCKAGCQRSLPLNHPASYTNGLCERHFFSMNCSSSDDEQQQQEQKENCPDPVEVSLREEQTKVIDNPFQPIRGDVRQTRETFDGHQWCVVDQKVDRPTSTSNQEDNLLQFIQLLANYRTIHDELKKQVQP